MSHNRLLCGGYAERCREQRIVGRQEAVWLSRPLERVELTASAKQNQDEDDDFTLKRPSDWERIVCVGVCVFDLVRRGFALLSAENRKQKKKKEGRKEEMK